MPTNPNMVAIQTVTVGAGGAAQIEFTSIPQTYTDLLIVLSGRTSNAAAADDFYVSFNSTTTNYSNRTLSGNGSTASSGNSTAWAGIYGVTNGANATASTFSNAQIYVPNYTSSNNKSVSIESVSENNATTAFAYMTAGLWSNSAAITSVKIKPDNNFAQYSTATLYGVTSYTGGTGGKAVGGTVTSDSNYWYHTFTSTGNFTPTQSITADILVIAGGGSGGNGGNSAGAGGGGAGGLLAHASQSLTATNYAVLVGAGGAGVSLTGSDGVKGNNGSNSQFGSLTASVGGGAGGGARSGDKTTYSPGNSGGSGGGSAQWNATGADIAGGTATSGQGNNGGAMTGLNGTSRGGAGGGGAGAVGASVAVYGAGAGGAGSSTYSSWASVTNTGASGSYAGGGGGSAIGLAGGTGGSGGGGAGLSGNVQEGTAVSGSVNTGSGGGGAGGVDNAVLRTSGAGGSGIVIVRYAK